MEENELAEHCCSECGFPLEHSLHETVHSNWLAWKKTFNASVQELHAACRQLGRAILNASPFPKK